MYATREVLRSVVWEEGGAEEKPEEMVKDD
jgi:hypothetical protein